ncbi:response regulator [Actinacidiphila oryziradicis]|uniref:Response regulator transcription factor n=1 Tax=Actinacidiphila oryziradicis TaxID=2571141 RepID=A0A4U0T8P0_9ACTN|nr:response regulator transcription factor [Actinacidiphila oryziradicis]TKA11225.1 response regulator transcription factor [Actinacidiphila oryziradicis]
MDQIDVLIVDDHPLVRSGVRSAIADELDINVVGEADSGLLAIQMVRVLKPDVVLMDVSLPPGINGLVASQSISNDDTVPDTKIVMLSVDADDDTLFEALRCGVSGFLLKDTPPEKIVDAVRTVARGGSVLSPSLTATVITEFARRPTVNRSHEVGLEQLTSREFDVFKLLVCGYHNEEIAKILVVAESTVKSHVQRLYDKLGVRDRVQVVIYAYEHGLIVMGQSGWQQVESACWPDRV